MEEPLSEGTIILPEATCVSSLHTSWPKQSHRRKKKMTACSSPQNPSSQTPVSHYPTKCDKRKIIVIFPWWPSHNSMSDSDAVTGGLLHGWQARRIISTSSVTQHVTRVQKRLQDQGLTGHSQMRWVKPREVSNWMVNRIGPEFWSTTGIPESRAFPTIPARPDLASHPKCLRRKNWGLKYDEGKWKIQKKFVSL